MMQETKSLTKLTGKLVFLFVLSTLIFASLAEAALSAQVVEKILPNGLKVLLLENHRAPVVAFQVWSV